MRKGESGVPEKTLRSKGENQQKLSPHMELIPRLESGPHWWEESALTTAPPLLSVKQKALSKILTKKVPKNACILQSLAAQFYDV